MTSRGPVRNTSGGETVSRKRLRFGPGTLLAVAAAVAIAATGQLNQPQPSQAGRLTFEANSRGELKRVERPLDSPGRAAPALLKPTPDLLLKRGEHLKLSARQIAGISRIASGWEQKKKLLDREIGTSARVFESTVAERKLSTGSIAAGLADYSQLSRRYNEEREASWRQAVALLSPSQAQRLQAPAPEKRGAAR